MPSILFSLFLVLTAIRLWISEKVGKPVKIIGIILLCLLACIGDWVLMDVPGLLRWVVL